MTRPPMRNARTPRVPGFPAQPPDVPAQAPLAPPPTPPARAKDRESISGRDGARQLNVRIRTPLLRRYKRHLRDLEDDDFETTLTEAVQAVMHMLPDDARELRDAITRWRRALDGEAS